MLKGLQEHLSALGRVPWLVGGDWNMAPEDVQLQWQRGGHYPIPDGPTQTVGRTLDFFLSSSIFPPTTHTIGDLQGTDYFLVTITLPGHLPRTLGWRLRQAVPLDADKLKALRDNPGPALTQSETPPTTWADWTAQAEALLCPATDTPDPPRTSRGVAPQYVRQKLTRPQSGKSAIGGNKAIAALRLAQARIKRLDLLLNMGKAHQAEGAALR